MKALSLVARLLAGPAWAIRQASAIFAVLAASAVCAAEPSIQAFEQPVVSYPLGPAFKVPEGKKIVIITCGSLGIGCQFGAKGAQEAATFLGWKSTIVDGKLDPQVWNTAVRQAVADGADGILLVAVTPALIQGGLEQAREAKVPVVTVFQPKFPDAPSTDGYVTSDHAVAGSIVGKWIAADSGGKAHALILDIPEYPELVKRNDALAAELARICPDCSIDRQRFGGATATQRLAPLVTIQLRQHPDITYVTGPNDATGTFIVQGIRQAGKSGSVKFVSFEGNPVGFEFLKRGEQAAELAISSPFAGWLAVDVLARKFPGQSYPEETPVPQRLFVSGTTLPNGSVGWDTDFDYRTALEARWLK